MNLFNFSKFNDISALLGFSTYLSITSERTSPSATSASKETALFITVARFSISIPLSFLYAESVKIPKSLDSLLIFSGVKYATSTKIFLVSLSIWVFCPPITPPIAIAFSSSAITSSPFLRTLSTPSRVVISSFSLAALIVMFPSTLSKSKACIGWLYSNITKFVISTTLFIGFNPIALILVFNHSGDSFILTFFITLPKYLLHLSLSSIFTFITVFTDSIVSAISITGYLTFLL